MSDDKDSKTEQATDKRRHEALSRGEFAKTPEIAVVISLAAAAGIFSLTLGSAAREVGGLASSIFSNMGSIRLQLDTVPTQLQDVALVIGKVLLPILGTMVLAALLSGGLQSGFNLTPEAFNISFDKLNPADGLQRLFNKSVLVHAGVDLMKTVAIALSLWTVARSLIEDPIFSAPVEIGYLGNYFGRVTNALLTRLVLALGVIAAISYWYEHIKKRKDLMMTRDEVKEETKQTQGDGMVKGAMRRMARRLLQKQMLKQVATADVVITNPTHYAVALRYERGRDHAPVVLAKGENRFAQRIKAMAAQHGVPTIENKPVARMLYALGRVGEPIPSELYQAVAEILALVYRTHRYYFYRLKSRRAEAEAESKGLKAAVGSQASARGSRGSDDSRLSDAA